MQSKNVPTRDHTRLDNIGSNSHSAIDSHIANSGIHGAGQWSTSGTSIYYSSGNVGVGINPTWKFDVSGGASSFVRSHSSTPIISDERDSDALWVYWAYTGTTADTPYSGVGSAAHFRVHYGYNQPNTIGTCHAVSAQLYVYDSGSSECEFTPFFTSLDADATGRLWGTDQNVFGPYSEQVDLMMAASYYISNYHPDPIPQGGWGVVITSRAGGGGGDVTGDRQNRQTYPLNAGLAVVGWSGTINRSVETNAFNTAIQVGGYAGGWCPSPNTSKFGTGIAISDWTDYGIHISGRKTGATGPDIKATGVIQIGNYASVTAADGMIRYTAGSGFEGRHGGVWGALGGGGGLSSPLTADLDFAEYKAVKMVCDNGATLPSSPTEGQWFLHTPTGRKVLMQYADGAWKAITSYGTMVMYVDNTDGTDAADKGYGADANAFKTIQYAIDAIPGTVGGDVTIYANGETYAAQDIIQGKNLRGNYTITIQGTLSTLDSGTSSGSNTNDFPATQTRFYDTAKEWGAGTAVESGAVTSTSASKLIDSGQNFLSTVRVGMYVYNSDDETVAYVTAVDSNTQLSLSDDIMLGVGYAYEISWGQHATKLLKITGGTGSGQERIIEKSGFDFLDIVGVWDTLPDNTSTYEICDWATTISHANTCVKVLSGQQNVVLKYLKFTTADTHGTYIEGAKCDIYSCFYNTPINSALGGGAAFFTSSSTGKVYTSYMYHASLSYGAYAVSSSMDCYHNYIQSTLAGIYYNTNAGMIAFPGVKGNYLRAGSQGGIFLLGNSFISAPMNNWIYGGTYGILLWDGAGIRIHTSNIIEKATSHGINVANGHVAFTAAATSTVVRNNGGFGINFDKPGNLSGGLVPSITGNTSGSIALYGVKRVTTQFDKTTNTTLADITGLSINVTANETYRFRAELFVDANATGGHKYAIAGTCTATAIKYTIVSHRTTSAAAPLIVSRQTALGGSAGEASATGYHTTIEGLITVNAAGTLTVQFAQNASSGTSSVLVGSEFKLEQVG